MPFGMPFRMPFGIPFGILLGMLGRCAFEEGGLLKPNGGVSLGVEAGALMPDIWLVSDGK